MRVKETSRLLQYARAVPTTRVCRARGVVGSVVKMGLYCYVYTVESMGSNVCVVGRVARLCSRWLEVVNIIRVA